MSISALWSGKISSYHQLKGRSITLFKASAESRQTSKYGEQASV